MATQQTMMERAKQGDADAITALMNRTLTKQGSRVQIRRQGSEYRFLVESAKLPDKQATAKWIQQGLTKLAVDDIQTVTVYGKSSDQVKPGWQCTFQLGVTNIIQSDPFAENSTDETSSEVLESTPAQSSELSVDLSEYCFTRNQSRLSGNRRSAAAVKGLSSSGLQSHPAGQKVLFSKGSNTPIWVFPSICAVFLTIAIALGISSVDEVAYLYPICDDSLASSEICMLSVQLLGDELETAYVAGNALPLTEPMKVEAVENCSDYGYYMSAYAFDGEGSGVSWPPPEKADAVELVSSSTTEVFPGVLLTDMVQSSRSAEGGSIRFGCIDYATEYSVAETFEYGEELKQVVALHRAAADVIPMDWPAEPYALPSETDLSVAKSLGAYDVFISLGANTLFTAVGIFAAVLFCSCYSCYSYKGVYQMASMLGVVNTVMHRIPGFGFSPSIAVDMVAIGIASRFVLIAVNVVAIGLASRFVEDFNIDWSNGYGPLARGVMTIMAVQLILSLLLYGAIAQFIF